MKAAKFIQIAVCDTDDRTETGVYALDTDGRVWFYDHDDRAWDRLPDKRLTA